MKRYYIFIASLAAVVLAVVIAHYISNAGPANDRIISQDLSQLQSEINNFAASQNTLPRGLNDLELSDDNLKSRLPNYEYKITSKEKYQLCATFSSSTRTNREIYHTTDNQYPYDHNKGYQCFTSTVYLNDFEDKDARIHD